MTLFSAALQQAVINAPLFDAEGFLQLREGQVGRADDRDIREVDIVHNVKRRLRDILGADIVEHDQPETVQYDRVIGFHTVVHKIGQPRHQRRNALFEQGVDNAAGVKAIANIPSREVLLSKLLGSFKSPMGKFARVIKAIAEKKAA